MKTMTFSSSISSPVLIAILPFLPNIKGLLKMCCMEIVPQFALANSYHVYGGQILPLKKSTDNQDIYSSHYL